MRLLIAVKRTATDKQDVFDSAVLLIFDRAFHIYNDIKTRSYLISKPRGFRTCTALLYLHVSRRERHKGNSITLRDRSKSPPPVRIAR